MKKLFLFIGYALFICSLFYNTAAQTTEFTYQGSLKDSGNPANATYDFEFALFDALSAGGQIGSTIVRNTVTVTNGIFAVKLDFGSVFPGGNRYLEIRVRQSGQPGITILSPRQLINSSPYSLKTLNADNATNAVTAATATNALQLGGVPASGYLQGVTTNSTLTGSGTTASPLSISLPLTLRSNSNFLPLVLVENTSGFGNSIYATMNGVNSDCPECAAIYGRNTGHGDGVYGTTTETSDGSAGVKGESTGAIGVIGIGGRSGVFGTSSLGNGVSGNSSAADSSGIAGFNSSTGSGVWGFSANGYGVKGVSTNGFAGYFLGNGLFTGNLTVNGSLNAALPAGSSNYVQNTATQQANSSFNISGNGIVGGSLSVGNAGTSGRLFLNRGTAISANSADINFGSSGGPDFSMGTSQGGADPSDFSIYNYGTNSNAFTIQRSTGFLGVGTNSPSERLNVAGNGIFSGSLTLGSDNGSKLFVRSGFNGQTGPIDAIKIQGPNFPNDSTSAQDLRWSFASAGSAAIRSYKGQIWDTYLQFLTSPLNSDTPTVRMHISENGNVGIGTTSPAFKLHVNGDLFATNGTFASVKTDSLALTNLSATGPGSSLCAIGPFPAIIGLCSSSSLRYKTNITSFTAGLNVIRRLKPIGFDWRRDGSHDFGLGAEDVEKVDPQLVFYKEGRLEGVRYERLPVVLINAVKEQQAQIDAQQKQIDLQQKQIHALTILACRNNKKKGICKDLTQ